MGAPQLHQIENVDAASQPWGTKLLNMLHLFSPTTWLGAIQFQAVSPFRTLDVKALTQGLLGVLLPAVLCGATSHFFVSHLLLVSTLLSPWTIYSAQSVLPSLTVFTSNVKSWVAFRTTSSQEVLLNFQTRMDDNRAFRHCRYDVFLPQQYKGKAILFFPGAFVDHTDYSEVAALLSDHGIVVVVVSMEPLRLAANRHLGVHPGRVKRIIRSVERRHLVYPADWSLAGHSLGSFAAMQLVSSLRPSRLVMWASADFRKLMANLSDFTETKALVVQGSEDNLCQMTEEAKDYFQANLPPNSLFHVIQGASHSQFASYSSHPSFGGIPTISKAEQHKQVCQLTADFLLN